MQIIEVDDMNRMSFDEMLPDWMFDTDTDEDRLILGAIDDDGRALGVIACTSDNRVFIISWIYVLSAVRRRRIGSALMHFMMQRMMYVQGMTHVRADYEDAEDADGISAFFRSFSFRISEYQAAVYDVSYSMLKIPAMPEKSVPAEGIMTLGSVPEFMLGRLSVAFSSDNDGIALELPVRRDDFDKDLSVVKVINDEICGAIFVSIRKYGPELSYAFVKPKKPVIFLELLYEFTDLFKDRYGTDEKVRIAAVSESADELITKLVPGAEKMKMCMAIRTLD